MRKIIRTVRRIVAESEDLFTYREVAGFLAVASLAGLVRYSLEPSHVDWGILSSIVAAEAVFLLFVAEVEDWKRASKARYAKVMREVNSR